MGPQEALIAELISQCNGGIQLVTIARFETPQHATDVIDALRHIHARHPMMRARILAGDTLCWACDVPFDRIDLRREGMGEGFDLETFYASEAARALDIASASWRAVLLADQAGDVVSIALIFNHGAVDGRSSLVVLNDLDRLLNDPGLSTLPSLPLLPSVERLLAAAGLSGDRTLLPDVRPETMWPVTRPAPGADRRRHGFLRIVPTPTIDALHARCRSEGLHLASAFAAAAYQAAKGLPNRTNYTAIIAPTDVRAECVPPVPGDTVGEFVSAINLLLGPDFDGASLIDVARELQRQFIQNRPPSLLLEPDIPHATIRAQAEQTAAASDVFASGICVTDIGDLDALSGRKVGLRDVMVMPSQTHGIHPIMIAIVTTSAGTCLTFGYSTPMQTHGVARTYGDRYIAALKTLAIPG